MTSPAPPLAHPLAHWDHATLRPVLLYDAPVPPPFRDLAVTHPFHSWWWLRNGTARIHVANSSWQTLAPGDWVLFPADVPRQHRLSADTHLISLSFHLAWPDARPLLDFRTAITGHHDLPLRRLATAAVRAWTPPPADRTTPLTQRPFTLPAWLHAESALRTFLASLVDRARAAGARVRTHETNEPRLARILADLAQNPTAGPLPYARWSTLAGLGRAQIDRLAHDHLGTTLRRWRDGLLDREIRHHLAAGQSSMKEIAARLGFADAAHFTHWVTRRHGAAPSALRPNWV